MKIRDIKSIPFRLKILATRRTQWMDENTGKVHHTDKETWSSAWAIAGPHSHTWWWVKKYGQLDCGCMRNPLTRRMILFSYAPRCYEHIPERNDS